MKKILCLMLIASSLSALSRGDIRSRVRERIKDDGPTSAEYYYSNTKMNSYINIVQDYIVRNTRCIEARFSTTTQSGQREYTLPAECISITKVDYQIITSSNVDSGEYKRLTP